MITTLLSQEPEGPPAPVKHIEPVILEGEPIAVFSDEMELPESEVVLPIDFPVQEPPENEGHDWELEEDWENGLPVEPVYNMVARVRLPDNCSLWYRAHQCKKCGQWWNEDKPTERCEVHRVLEVMEL